MLLTVAMVTLEGECREGEFLIWCPHQESNLELALRRGPLYPFNYEDAARRIIAETGMKSRTSLWLFTNQISQLSYLISGYSMTARSLTCIFPGA